LVGAPGFEPGASCAQASRDIFWKPFPCNIILENKRLGKKLGGGKRCQNVAPHAEGPPNFPHSGITTKVLLLVPTSATPTAVWKTAFTPNSSRCRYSRPLPTSRGSCSLIIAMRRLATILLVVLLGGVPAFSALATASSSSDLPACCKKDGAHMCAMRHGRAKQEEGNTKLFAYCPFAGKGTPAVPGQRVGNVVEANSAVAPLAASSLGAKAPAFVFASTPFLPNSKRGPPSSSL